VSQVTFWIFALIAVASAAGMVARRNPIHSALLLAINLAAVAGFYLMMRAEFLAVVQLLVYAGAIAVLFWFAIMVLIPGKDELSPDPLRPQRWLAVPLAGVLLLLVGAVLRSGLFRGPARGPAGGSEALYAALLTDFLLPFEVTSFLLLAALIGVMALAKRRVA
jgi:NADH-quinone oxidoreductase subunit J